MARWGLVPAGATVDPGGVDPIQQPSWLLDLDGFMAKPQELDIDSVVQQAERLAERIYSVFRWAVTDEFLKHYGGKNEFTRAALAISQPKRWDELYRI